MKRKQLEYAKKVRKMHVSAFTQDPMGTGIGIGATTTTTSRLESSLSNHSLVNVENDVNNLKNKIRLAKSYKHKLLNNNPKSNYQQQKLALSKRDKMNSYAKSIPKPVLDAKLLLKEKLKKTTPEHGHGHGHDPRSGKRYHGSERQHAKTSPQTSARKSQEATRWAKGYDVDPDDDPEAQQDDEGDEFNGRTTTTRLKFPSATEDDRTGLGPNPRSTMTTAAYTKSKENWGRGSGRSRSRSSSEGSGSGGNNYPLNKNSLILPPISPTQFQVWTLEQEHLKAMNEVENIKKELHL